MVPRARRPLSPRSRRTPRKSAPRRVGKADSIAALAQAAGAIAGGDRERRLPLGTAAELRSLAKSVNAIVDVLALKERLLGENIQSLQTANRELREAQETVLRSEKLAALGRVAAGIAHEIGNPIGSIIGYLDLLKRKRIAIAFKRDTRRQWGLATFGTKRDENGVLVEGDDWPTCQALLEAYSTGNLLCT